jgi:hypothetical protein
MNARMASSGWDRVRASIDNNAARIEVIVGSTTTQIGSTVSLAIKNGDVFEFYFGTPTQPRRFWLKQNGTTVLDVEDTVAVSNLGASYRKIGIGGRADNYLAFFQNPPPALAGWTWATT